MLSFKTKNEMSQTKLFPRLPLKWISVTSNGLVSAVAREGYLWFKNKIISTTYKIKL
jgi:hypothetical protein